MKQRDDDDPTDCKAHGYGWDKARFCKPCFWRTFPRESWDLYKLWKLVREVIDGDKGRRYGFNDERLANFLRTDHPAFRSDVFEMHEVQEILLELTGHANEALLNITASEWLKETS